MADTYTAYDAKGIREDLEGMIYDISPFETPLQSNAGKVKVTNRAHEWQTDALRAASTSNAHVEGAASVNVARTPTVRVKNYTQILKDTAEVSGTLEAVDKAGRAKEMAYQMVKIGREQRRDFEAICLNNQASLVGDNTTASKLGGLPSWLTSNVSRASGGASGGFSTSTGLTVAATDVTTGFRTFTETLLKGVQQTLKKNGGEPTILMLGTYNKGQFSNATNFPGIATLRSNVAQNTKGSMATVIGAADVYLGDFGTLQVVTNIFQRDRDAFLIDPEHIKIGTLRPLKPEDLAKVGDSERKHIVMEKTLVVNNEAAHGIVADLTTS
ncbi:DUF5309 domain-containing protein [Mesorhizobium sp. A556]